MNYLKNKKWKNYFDKDLLEEIMVELNKYYEKTEVYPAKENLFRCFELISPKDIKVVIIGQDPYHGEGQANGLAFSLTNSAKITPSLRNIFKELENDLGVLRTNKDLEDIAKQGVLLLNAILSVEKGKPGSHHRLGWEKFTNKIIVELQKNENPIVFVLWGNYAKDKECLIDNSKHYVISSTHPSPFSARKGFFGSKPFSKINEILKKEYNQEIRW